MRQLLPWLLCLLWLLPASAQTYSAGTIADPDGWTYLRAGADLQEPVLDKVYEGDRFLIVRRVGDFYDVLLLKVQEGQDAFGYLHKSRVKVVASGIHGAACIHDPDGWVHLRSGPSTRHSSLAKIPRQDGLLILQKGPWCRVLTRQGQTGYVHSSRIEWLLPRN